MTDHLLEDDTTHFVGAIDLGALSRRIGISEAELCSAIFDGLGSEGEGSQGEESEGKVADTEAPSESASLPPVALITAARRVDHGPVSQLPELQRVNGRTVLVHSLLALEQAGIHTAVVLVANGREEIIASVEAEFQPRVTRTAPRMAIEFLDLGEDWAGSHAESILRARRTLAPHCGGAHFPEPFFLVSSDRIYHAKLLGMLGRLGSEGDASDANFLVTEDPTRQRVAPGVGAFTAVRVRTQTQARRPNVYGVERVGRFLPVYSGIDVGLFRLDGATFFAELERLQAQRNREAFSGHVVAAPLILAEVLDHLAQTSFLSAMPVGSLPYASFETPLEAEWSQEVFPEVFAAPLKETDEDLTVNYKVEELDTDEARPRVAILPVRTEGIDEGTDDFDRAALLSDTIDPHLRDLADQEDRALLVRTTDEATNLPDTALLMPARLETAANADDDEDGGSVMCDLGAPLALFRAQLGLGLPSDVTGVSIALEEAGATDETATGEPTLVATVSHKVPLVGWVILIVATLTGASSVLVVKGTTHGVYQGYIQIWRYLAAVLACLPIAIYNSFCEQRAASPAGRRTNTATMASVPRASEGPVTEHTPLMPSPAKDHFSGTSFGSRRSSFQVLPRALPSAAGIDWETKVAIAGCVLGFWASSFAFMVAISYATQPELPALFSNLAPLVIVLARCVGLSPGGFPNMREIGGSMVGLLGAAICGLSRESAEAGAGDGSIEYSDTVAIIGSLVSSAAHAIYSVNTKIARKGGVSAPTLHLCMEGGAAILTLMCLAALGKINFSLDPMTGMFGFLYPSQPRLLAWTWMGIGVDTFGNLGYTAAMKYVSPLLVVMAGLLQGSICVIEASILGIEEPPNLRYILGTIILFLGGLAVANAEGPEGSTESLKLKPGTDGIYELQRERTSDASEWSKEPSQRRSGSGLKEL